MRRGSSFEYSRISDEVLEGLERSCANLLGCRLGGDGHGLLGERIDSLTLLGCRLLHDAKLNETRDDEFAGAASSELLLDKSE